MDFFIDRGGTFTDCLAIDDVGSVRVAKVLSSDRAPLEGMRLLVGLSASDPIPPRRVRMGATLATNALLERKGQRFALLITRGFRDLLEFAGHDRRSTAPFGLAGGSPGAPGRNLLNNEAIPGHTSFEAHPATACA